MSEAFFAQMTAGYSYFNDILKNNKNWAMLSPEQQGQLLEDAYAFGYFHTPKQWNDSRLSQADAVKLINYMPNVLAQLRAGQGAT